MPYAGDMTIDMTGSDFEIGSITCTDMNEDELLDVDPSADTFTARDLPPITDYECTAEGGDGATSGNFEIFISCTSDAPTRSPTDEPTTSPTDEPTGSPTKSPTNTAEPTTPSPTTPYPTTPFPTTSQPTFEPTNHPTEEPTGSPTKAPITPAPTHPGELICGSTSTGDFNGDVIAFEVRMPYAGDMTIDMTGSDFEIGSITCTDMNEDELLDVDPSADTFTARDLPPITDYECTAEGGDGATSGNFEIFISCTSDAPTRSPTEEPTTSPTDEPTASPTKGPTTTIQPTREPTTSPTDEPTGSPTNGPTTPSPTHPGELICGDRITGDYNGKPVEFEVRMPYDGDMTLDMGGSDFEIGVITCYDSDGNELTDSDAASYSLTIHDLSHGEDYTCVAEGGSGVASGTFDLDISCTSDAPTRSPTDEPTASPTKGPTTPSPTHPGELICGDRITGEYNGEPVEIEVRMPYDGDMTVDMGASDFEIGAITCYDSDGNELTDSDAAPYSLTIHDLSHGQDYTCVAEGGSGVASGTFDLEISCTSDAPTRSPTGEPTPSPTDFSTTTTTEGETTRATLDTALPESTQTNTLPTGIPPPPEPTDETTEEPGECYQDDDCGRNQSCEKGQCQDNDVVCYGDDECRGKQVCDMENYICVDPTPSPVMTEAPGCCYGDSYKANEKCARAMSQDKCDKQGCHWRVTDDPRDCELTTSTSTEEPGCCSSENPKKFALCNEQVNREYCERMKECVFVSGVDAVCEPQETTAEVGCCRGSSYKAQAKCFGIADRTGCERKQCEWVETDDESDCELTTTKTPTTTTTTEEPGCCAGDSAKSNPKCNAKPSQDKCERSSSCYWLVTDEPSDCELPPTTSEEPGCCYGNPDAAYSKKWMDTCTGYYTQRECLQLTDDDGSYRCHWESKADEYDCSQLWPTTTTTTVAPGCCRGSSYKAQAKCLGIDDRAGCERKKCEWVETDDESDCEITTASPTEESGCCAGESAKKNPACNGKESRDKCERGKGCYWKDGEDADCTWTETISPGCCAGTSQQTTDKCSQKDTQESCDRMSKCMWEAGEDADCSWPTTTEAPWMGSKPMSKMSKKQRSSHHSDQVLYGADAQGVGSAVAEQMQATVSLSTLLLLIVIAVAVRQLYCCWTSNNNGYAKLEETAAGRNDRAYYQSV